MCKVVVKVSNRLPQFPHSCCYGLVCGLALSGLFISAWSFPICRSNPLLPFCFSEGSLYLFKTPGWDSHLSLWVSPCAVSHQGLLLCPSLPPTHPCSLHSVRFISHTLGPFSIYPEEVTAAVNGFAGRLAADAYTRAGPLSLPGSTAHVCS